MEKKLQKSLMYRAIKAHVPIYADPLDVQIHEELILSGRTDNWDGFIWLWAEASGGRTGWVPDDLPAEVDGETVASYSYSARELDAAADECFGVLKTSHGWAWCANSESETGWIPLKVLAPC